MKKHEMLNAQRNLMIHKMEAVARNQADEFKRLTNDLLLNSQIQLSAMKELDQRIEDQISVMSQVIRLEFPTLKEQNVIG